MFYLVGNADNNGETSPIAVFWAASLIQLNENWFNKHEMMSGASFVANQITPTKS